MKRVLLLIPAAITLACCGSSKATQGKGTAAQRFNLPDNPGAGSKAVYDTNGTEGAQYIPILGKSEQGTRSDLEGSWLLLSINGKAVPENNLNSDLISKKPAQGTETRHDSVTTTKTVKGVTHTTTTVEIDRMGEQQNRITPPQSQVYHIPQKPSINFYGSNETFSGFTGCNKYSGRYTLSDTNSISLKSAAPSTRMVCIGDYDEDTFLNTLKHVSSFKSQNGQLQLLEGNNVVLVFEKSK